MILRALALIAGVALICGGLAFSPVPWLAPIVAGGLLVAVGLLLRIPPRTDR